MVARDSATGEIGVVVQSRAFNVGMAVPWARAGIGAVATQAQTNESFGPMGIRLLRSGLSAKATLDSLLAGDAERDHRQVGVIDAEGRAETYTGSKCSDWAGGRRGPNYACQGNILAGEKVVTEMERAFLAERGELARRLLAALEAGQAAGGDKRGVQSAALLVVRPSRNFPEYEERYIDLRVDDHVDPIREIRRIYTMMEGSDLVEAHIRYLDEYRAAGDSARATLEASRVGDILTRALADTAMDAGTLNGLAWYTATNDVFLDEALLAAKRAVEKKPDDSGILDTLAEVHWRRGEKKEAIAVIRRALALSPKDAYLESQLEKFRKKK